MYLDGLSNEVELDVDVLGPGMVDRICRDGNGCLVVTVSLDLEWAIGDVSD